MLGLVSKCKTVYCLIFQLSMTLVNDLLITTIMMMKIPEGGGKGLPLALATLITTIQPFYMSCPKIVKII